MVAAVEVLGAAEVALLQRAPMVAAPMAAAPMAAAPMAAAPMAAVCRLHLEDRCGTLTPWSLASRAS